MYEVNQLAILTLQPPSNVHTLAGAIRSQFGLGTGPILLDEVQCTGHETRLVDCVHNGISTHDCSHSQDAGVICQSK